MNTTKSPQVIGMVFCEEFAVDPVARRTSLSGLFQARQFESFPTPLSPMTVFATLYDGVGEGIMELTVGRFADEKDVHRHQRWFVFPG